ncbi:hypothetical protein D3C80_1742760 [compost metagenome]
MPTPEKKNSSRNIARKPQKAPGWSLMPMKNSTPPTHTAMATNTQRLIRPPPKRSARPPVKARARAPISGPRKANFSTSTWGKRCPASSGKPAEKPMKLPKVPV